MKEEFKLKLKNYIQKNYLEEISDSVLVNEEVPFPRKKPGRATPVLRNENLRVCACPKIPLDKMMPTFQEKLFMLIDKSGMSDADIYKRANIDRRLFSKIRSDINYQPNKNTVIQLVFGLALEIDTALDLLASAGYTLSFSKKSDVIIRFYIENKNYDLIDLNETLYDYDLKTLF